MICYRYSRILWFIRAIGFLRPQPYSPKMLFNHFYTWTIQRWTRHSVFGGNNVSFSDPPPCILNFENFSIYFNILVLTSNFLDNPTFTLKSCYPLPLLNAWCRSRTQPKIFLFWIELAAKAAECATVWLLSLIQTTESWFFKHRHLIEGNEPAGFSCDSMHINHTLLKKWTGYIF